MAKKPLILDYYDIGDETQLDRKSTFKSPCKACRTEISGSVKITSNFISHIRVRHPEIYCQFIQRKTDNGASPSSTQPVQGAIRAGSNQSKLDKYDAEHPIQRKINAVVVKLIAVNVLPLQFVDCREFHELFEIAHPRYQPFSEERLRNSILPSLRNDIERRIKAALQEAEMCSFSVNICNTPSGIQSNGEGHQAHVLAAIGVRFVDEQFRIQSAFLSCRQFKKSNRIGEDITEFVQSVGALYGIDDKLFRLLINSSSANDKNQELPGYSDDNGGLRCDQETRSSDSNSEDGHPEPFSVDQLQLSPERVNCYQRCFELCIEDALQLIKSFSNVISLASQTIRLIRLSPMSPLLDLQDDPIPSDNAPPWRLQLRTIRALLEIKKETLQELFPSGVIISDEERTTLTELTEMLLPFEEVDSLIRDDITVSAMLPSYRGLKHFLTELNAPQLSQLQIILLQIVEARLGWISEDPLFGCAAILDPNFGLSWTQSCQEMEDWMEVFEREASPFHIRDDQMSEGAAESTPIKKARLFSYLKRREPVPFREGFKRQIDEYLSAIEVYVGSASDFWRTRSAAFPALAKLAKRVFSVPVSSIPLKQAFVNSGHFCGPEQCRLDSDVFESLVFIKANKHLL